MAQDITQKLRDLADKIEALGDGADQLIQKDQNIASDFRELLEVVPATWKKVTENRLFRQVKKKTALVLEEEHRKAIWKWSSSQKSFCLRQLNNDNGVDDFKDDFALDPLVDSIYRTDTDLVISSVHWRVLLLIIKKIKDYICPGETNHARITDLFLRYGIISDQKFEKFKNGLEAWLRGGTKYEDLSSRLGGHGSLVYLPDVGRSSYEKHYYPEKESGFAITGALTHTVGRQATEVYDGMDAHQVLQGIVENAIDQVKDYRVIVFSSLCVEARQSTSGRRTSRKRPAKTNKRSFPQYSVSISGIEHPHSSDTPSQDRSESDDFSPDHLTQGIRPTPAAQVSEFSDECSSSNSNTTETAHDLSSEPSTTDLTEDEDSAEHPLKRPRLEHVYARNQNVHPMMTGEQPELNHTNSSSTQHIRAGIHSTDRHSANGALQAMNPATSSRATVAEPQTTNLQGNGHTLEVDQRRDTDEQVAYALTILSRGALANDQVSIQDHNGDNISPENHAYRGMPTDTSHLDETRSDTFIVNPSNQMQAAAPGAERLGQPHPCNHMSESDQPRSYDPSIHMQVPLGVQASFQESYNSRDVQTAVGGISSRTGNEQYDRTHQSRTTFSNAPSQDYLEMPVRYTLDKLPTNIQVSEPINSSENANDSSHITQNHPVQSTSGYGIPEIPSTPLDINLWDLVNFGPNMQLINPTVEWDLWNQIASNGFTQ